MNPFPMKMTSLARGALIIATAAVCCADKNNNATIDDSGSATLERPTAVDSGGIFGKQFFICLFLAVVAIVIGVLACRYMKNKQESSGSYATGNDLPAPLVHSSGLNKF